MARILIAEDERDIRDLITFTLRFAGHDVISTSNGEEALRSSLLEIPDLVLLDVRMPRMDGYEVCRQIKNTPLTRHIPVVFLSAKGQVSEVQAGMEAGALEYIVKPFSPEQLADRVRLILLESIRDGGNGYHSQAPGNARDELPASDANGSSMTAGGNGRAS